MFAEVRGRVADFSRCCAQLRHDTDVVEAAAFRMWNGNDQLAVADMFVGGHFLYIADERHTSVPSRKAPPPFSGGPAYKDPLKFVLDLLLA